MKRNAYAVLGWVVWKLGRPWLRRKLDRDHDDADESPGGLRKESLKRRIGARRRSKAVNKAARTRSRS